VAVFKAVPISRAFDPDERQRQAIEHLHGPMLVVAGAGTGKTTVLTRRIAQLIHEKHARPDEILAVTYTENATREMRERVGAELHGTDISGLRVETFHAYCNNLLIRCNQNFGVLDEKDLWIYLRKRIRDLRLNYFVRAANLGKFLDDLLDFMRRCQDELVGPEKYAEYVARLERGELPVPRVARSKESETLSDEEVLGRCREIANVFVKVEAMLREENLGSFGHMITRAHELLEQDAGLLAQERKRARFILIDEFQDANFAQVKVLKMLAGEERNIFAVGDPDQAIYRFRGASSAAFALFQHNFPGARLVSLEQNRRSTTPILNCAYALISKNPSILVTGEHEGSYRRAPLTSAREQEALGRGQEFPSAPVDVVVLSGKDAECFDLVTTLRKIKGKLRCKWSDFAVLYRQHLHRDELAMELAQQGVPFSIENMDVMDTPETRDLFACLGAIVSPRDGAGLFRVAALPQFAIDPEKLRAALGAIKKNDADASIASVLAEIEGGPAVLEALQAARDEIAQRNAKSHAALELIARHFQLNRNALPLVTILDFIGKWEEKPKAITRTGEVAELLEYLEYFREARGTISLPSRNDDAVHLMTPHTAKGLEFDHVFIIRASSPSFPASFKESLVEFPRELRDPDSLAHEDDKVLHGQEERRLFYVAMTRARDSLTLYAKRGTGKNDPSPPGYLRELLSDKSLTHWLRKRDALPFQTDIFGGSRAPVAPSRTTAWLSMAPASDLSARLSASAVQLYETCPLQFKLEREWRIPGEVPAAMQYGATMHRVLRAYYDSVRFQRTMTEDDLIGFFKADLAEAGLQDGYQYELYEEQGIAQLQEFLSARRQSPMPEVLHTEEWFEMKVSGVTVVGRIDRIDKLEAGKVAIIDYKSGKPQDQEDADESLQLSIYAIAAREKWGYEADQIAFYNLATNSQVTTRRSDIELQDAKARVEEVAHRVAVGKFEPKPGFHCTFCAYRSLCPATEKRIYSISSGKQQDHRN
jgi:DNA helicase-2/ATP-dependent DNA helicase PcrA